MNSQDLPSDITYKDLGRNMSEFVAPSPDPELALSDASASSPVRDLPSDISYKDQGRNMSHFVSVNDATELESPSNTFTFNAIGDDDTVVPSNISYKDQALTVNDLQRRQGVANRDSTDIGTKPRQRVPQLPPPPPPPPPQQQQQQQQPLPEQAEARTNIPMVQATPVTSASLATSFESSLLPEARPSVATFLTDNGTDPTPPHDNYKSWKRAFGAAVLVATLAIGVSLGLILAGRNDGATKSSNNAMTEVEETVAPTTVSTSPPSGSLSPTDEPTVIPTSPAPTWSPTHQTLSLFQKHKSQPMGSSGTTVSEAIGDVFESSDPSDCALNVVFPGSSGQDTRYYEIIGPFRNPCSNATCVNVFVDVGTCEDELLATVYVAAYTDFTDTDIEQNYLGGVGDPDVHTEFSFELAGSAEFYVVGHQFSFLPPFLEDYHDKETAGEDCVFSVRVEIDEDCPAMTLTASPTGSPSTQAPSLPPTQIQTLAPSTSGAPSSTQVPSFEAISVERVSVMGNVTDTCDGSDRIFEINMSVKGAGGVNGSRTVPFEIVLALDSSGSMVSNDPTGLRQQATIEFINRLDPAIDRAAVISWDSKIDFSTGLTNDVALLRNSANQIDASGATNLDIALNQAVADLGVVQPFTQVIVFLTDGAGLYTNCSSNGPASTAASQGFKIYSVGFGGADSASLVDMAECTGGTAFSSQSAASLREVFGEIFDYLLNSTVPSNVTTTLVLEPAYDLIPGSESPTADSITMNAQGQTTLVWQNVDFSRGLSANQNFNVSFRVTAASSGLFIDQLDSSVTYQGQKGGVVATALPALFIDVDTLPNPCSDFCSDEDLCTVDTRGDRGRCVHTPVECSQNQFCDSFTGGCVDEQSLVPCVAVLDEWNDVDYTAQWRQFRDAYPQRPFCLLVVGHLVQRLPTGFNSDTYGNPDGIDRTVVSLVNRDNGNMTLASDWFNLCGFDRLSPSSIPYVGLFVDDSGSMTINTVQASLTLFMQKLESRNLGVTQVFNANEQWIDPFLTSLAPNT